MRQVFKRTLIAMLTLAMGSARAAEEEKPIDCANAVSTYEMNACADKDFTAADAELNRVYAEAL